MILSEKGNYSFSIFFTTTVKLFTLLTVPREDPTLEEPVELVELVEVIELGFG